MRPSEAIAWIQHHRVQPRRGPAGAVYLDEVPAGVKVPTGLTAALKQYPGDFPIVSLSDAVATGRDARRTAREREHLVRERGESRGRSAAVPAHIEAGMSLPDLMHRDFAPRREFVPGVIEQGVTLLAAKAKIGKTWFVLGTGLALAQGGMALGKIPVEQTDVLILALEDGEQRLQDRFALLLNGASPPHNLHLFTDWPRLDAGGAMQLDAYLADHPDTKVVFIDTLAKIRPKRRKGGDLYDEDYDIGSTLKIVAEKHGVAIILIYHTRKARAEDPLDEIRDTLGLTGGVDNCLVLRRARGQADAELFVSGRDIAEEKGYALTWDRITAQWIIAGDAAEFSLSTARRQVLDVLAEAPDGLTPLDVARKLNKPHSAVKKLMWTMSKDGTLRATDGRYTKRGNSSNPVTESQESLAEQGGSGAGWVTLGLPSVGLSNPEGNPNETTVSPPDAANATPGYRVTTVTSSSPTPPASFPEMLHAIATPQTSEQPTEVREHDAVRRWAERAVAGQEGKAPPNSVARFCSRHRIPVDSFASMRPVGTAVLRKVTAVDAAPEVAP